jgi:DNA-binding PadR family transcriptional regulator
MSNNDWGFRGFSTGFGHLPWDDWCGPSTGRGSRRRGQGPRGGRRRRQFFESGEVKYVILRLIREKPRHGYEIIKALEQETGGWYTASAGTVYPTLQLLEDQGHVRIVETGGKKVYHITPEGEAFLEEHRDVLDDILERVREAVEGLAGGTIGDLNETFARMAGMAYKQAWRERPGDDRTEQIVDILRKAQQDIEEVLKKEE